MLSSRSRVGSEGIVVRARGSEFELRAKEDPYSTDDRAAFFQVVMAGEYDELLRSIHPGDVIVDAGANIGCFTTLAASRAGRRGRVISIEPDSANLTQLQKNVRRNKLSNVSVEPIALLDRPGEVVTFRSGGVTAQVSEVGHDKVPTSTLQEIVERAGVGRLDILKIDVEGSEDKILASPGFRRILANCRGVAVEVHSRKAEHDFRYALAEGGFSISGPRYESALILRIAARVVLHPLLTLGIYWTDLLSTSIRLIRGMPKELMADRYFAGVITALRPVAK